ncbi:MAG TPA: hypothetical protein VME66_03190 [Candidatus Acidoferrales bacterium]|nr:hypothetical protein [Candidatus Acidoferrales bacterium]
MSLVRASLLLLALIACASSPCDAAGARFGASGGGRVYVLTFDSIRRPRSGIYQVYFVKPNKNGHAGVFNKTYAFLAARGGPNINVVFHRGSLPCRPWFGKVAADGDSVSFKIISPGGRSAYLRFTSIRAAAMNANLWALQSAATAIDIAGKDRSPLTGDMRVPDCSGPG